MVAFLSSSQLPACPLHAVDATGQLPLHYAVCSSHATKLASHDPTLTQSNT